MFGIKITHFYQKVLIFSTWFLINSLLIITSILYSHYWYIFLIPLSLSTLFNCLSVILIIIFRIKNLFIKTKKNENNEYNKRSIAYLVPCYNENEHELRNTINSIKNQTGITTNNKMLFIVCDGRIKGPESEITTEIGRAHV